MSPEARQIRVRWTELRKLINDWDPAGLIASGAPADEYDDVSGPLLRFLDEQQEPAAIADYLGSAFGGQGPDAAAFAERLVSWYENLGPRTNAG